MNDKFSLTLVTFLAVSAMAFFTMQGVFWYMDSQEPIFNHTFTVAEKDQELIGKVSVEYIKDEKGITYTIGKTGLDAGTPQTYENIAVGKTYTCQTHGELEKDAPLRNRPSIEQCKIQDSTVIDR